LLVLLNGCEIWYFILREEHRLRVLENRVQRKIFGPKREEVTGEWRRLGKAIPLQAWTGPELSRRLTLPDFQTVGT
jgi:hypothetical protein